jgi:hypothetical protein
MFYHSTLAKDKRMRSGKHPCRSMAEFFAGAIKMKQSFMNTRGYTIDNITNR